MKTPLDFQADLFILKNRYPEMKTIESTLPRVMKFEGSNRQVFNISLHAQFHYLQYGLVKAVDQTKLKIPAAVMTTWESANNAETKLDQESAVSERTAKLLALDNERDNILANIFYVIRGYRYSTEAPKKEAALRLAAKLKPYLRIRTITFEMESARIRSLEDDVSTMAADIAAVGLTSTFTQLHTTNEAYEKLRMERRTDSADTKLPTAQQIRPIADEAYEIVCQYIQAAYLYATADEDNALIEQLVNRMNKVTVDLKATHRQSLAQRKAADKKPTDPSKPKTPKEPKQPKDPKTPDQPKEPKQPEKPGGGAGEQPKKPDEKPKDPKKPGDDGNPDIKLPEE